MIFPGDESLAKVLRLKTAHELISHPEDYAIHTYLLLAAESMGGIETVLQTLIVESRRSSLNALNCNNEVERIWMKIKDEGRQTRQTRHWGSMLQVLALSNLLQRNIQCVYPPAIDSYAKPLIDGIVKPSK